MLDSRPARVRTTASRRTERTPTSTPLIPTASRPLFLLVVMVLCAGALISRLVFWQILQHASLSAQAARQHAALDVQPPARGQILDAHGSPLATDVTTNLVVAVPKEIVNPTRTARLLAPLVHRTPSHLEQLFADYSGYVILDRNADSVTSDSLRQLGLPGIILDPVVYRDYPDGSLAAQTLGFVRTDGTGQYGIEQYYNSLLAGKAGLRSVLKDTAGHTIQISPNPSIPSQDGATLSLSLDSVVQGLAEDELQKAVKQHTADGGTIIVMDPRTGYILGMASTPTYNPNKYTLASGNASLYLNPAIQWTYEPGSTFKIITMAAGLNEHVITPDTAFDDTGVFNIANVTIHNWNDGGFGMETMTQVLQHSANVGASYVAQRLGTSAFYKYIRRFRFGQPTGVDLQGEWAGEAPLPGQSNWTIVSQFTNSFGQGIAVTPLQLIRAVAAVANGGLMMKPQIVERIAYRGHIIEHPPVPVAQVISPQTAHTLTHMLVQSAVGGEAALGLVHGYNVAAKTGTANVAGPGGGYIQGDTIASIIGYAPAYHPRFIALIIIRHPRDTPWGSMAAAPVLHNLFQDLFMYYHIPPASHAATP